MGDIFGTITTRIENIGKGLVNATKELPKWFNNDKSQIINNFDKADKPLHELKTINQNLENQIHPETGIKYVKDIIEMPDGSIIEGSFPDFKDVSIYETTIDEQFYKISDAGHIRLCNKHLKDDIKKNKRLANKFSEPQKEQINNLETPENYTWHHHQQPGKFQLVNRDVHLKTAHTGGRSIWGGGNNAR